MHTFEGIVMWLKQKSDTVKSLIQQILLVYTQLKLVMIKYNVRLQRPLAQLSKVSLVQGQMVLLV